MDTVKKKNSVITCVFNISRKKGFPIRKTYTFHTDVLAVPKFVLDACRGDFPNNFEHTARTKTFGYGAKGIRILFGSPLSHSVHKSSTLLWTRAFDFIRSSSPRHISRTIAFPNRARVLYTERTYSDDFRHCHTRSRSNRPPLEHVRLCDPSKIRDRC